MPPVTALIDAAKNSATEMKDSRSQAELLEAIEDLRAATEQPNIDVGDAMEKAGRLQRSPKRLAYLLAARL